MQGKGIIKFFLVVMLLVTIFQYFFYIPTNSVENDAADYAEEQSGETDGEAFRMHGHCTWTVFQTRRYSKYHFSNLTPITT